MAFADFKTWPADVEPRERKIEAALAFRFLLSWYVALHTCMKKWYHARPQRRSHREILYHTLLPDRGSSLNSLLGYSEQGLPDIGGVHAVLPRLRLYAYPLMRRIAEGRESSQGRRR